MESSSSRSLIMNNDRLVAPHRRHDSSSPLSTWVGHHHHEEERSRSLYVCSFCRRDFSSAQALGGHMNVHRRDRATLLLSSSNLTLPPPPPPPPPSSSSPSLTLTNYRHYDKPTPNSQPPKFPATVSPPDQLLGSPRNPIFVFPFSNNGTPAEKGGDGEEMVSLELGIGWKQEAAAIPLPVLDLELRLRCST